jgi:hypothetical protein
MIGCCRKRKYIFNIIYEFVISKRLSGHYKFEFTPERKDNFTSNAYELRMDCESAAEELRLVLETCSMSSLKQQRKISLG